MSDVAQRSLVNFYSKAQSLQECSGLMIPDPSLWARATDWTLLGGI